MTQVQDIISKIVGKLELSNRIRHVYAYNGVENPGYPYAVVIPTSFEGDYASYGRNKRSFNVGIEVYIEREKSNFGASKAERIAREITDEVLTMFDMDTTLSGTVSYCRPSSGELQYRDGLIEERAISINLECVSLVTST